MFRRYCGRCGIANVYTPNQVLLRCDGCNAWYCHKCEDAAIEMLPDDDETCRHNKFLHSVEKNYLKALQTKVLLLGEGVQ